MTLPSTAGIVYSIAPANLGNGSADVVVTVTATVTDGHGWGQLPEGWVRVDAASATWTRTLSKTSCDEVTPAAPELVQAVCVNGVVTRPTLTLADTDVITYSADPAGPYSQGQSVTVTATLDEEGVAWPATLPQGWTELDRYDGRVCRDVCGEGVYAGGAG